MVARGNRVPLSCLLFFTAVWIGLALWPRYRTDWVLENLLTFVGVPLAVLTFRRFRFSNAAYVQATCFLVLHTIGSHYTYSEVPLGDWLRDALGLARNHYDRIVHFGFGVLMLRPIRELTLPGRKTPRRVAGRWLAFGSVAACSVLYELVEWLVASIVDPEAGTAYLGTQGDVWDAQKDMALACTGALAGLLLDRKQHS